MLVRGIVGLSRQAGNANFMCANAHFNVGLYDLGIADGKLQPRK